MLIIYLDKNKIKQKIQYFNNSYFDLYVNKIAFNNNVISIISKIDGVKYIGDYRILSKFQPKTAIRVEELSSGCKTAINVYSFPQNIFYVGECGDNALQVICNYNHGNIFVDDFFIPLPFQNTIQVITQQGATTVNNNKELEKVFLLHFRN